ncbi:MAG: S41 family peptidase [Eubacteriales bacterium]|nr:S41 family peptidase [Eubacteriales bacterium]
MENKKVFTKGCLCGIAFIIALNLLITSVDKAYRRVVSKNLTIEQKMEEIERIVRRYSVNEFPEYVNEGLYKGMVSTLNDRYSYYMSKKEFEEFLQETDGNYVGIGIMISMAEGVMKISKIFDGSPAKDEGILPDDIIIKVDEEEVTLENYDAIVSKIKGEEGTKVKLTIYRENDGKEYEYNVLRKSIEVPTVEYKMLEDKIGYIAISQFDRVTFDQFKEAFDKLNSENAEGLIIDLRNNPGGLLTTVCKITDLFVPEGTITYIEDKYGKKQYEYSDANFYNKPLVILVNESSASASEVLSGAVKDYKVGELVGETTFGKGVVQNIYTLSDGSGIKVTIAKYYTPNGICIDGTGIEPDYPVENNPNSDVDLQLEKGIEVIKAKLGNNN